MTDDDDCGAISGMNELHGKPKYWEKTYSMPLCPPQPPRDFPGIEPGPPKWEAGD
jgi:hypothetical protein